MHVCIVIPHYDHVDQFRSLLPALVAQGLPLIVVDDASPAAAYTLLEALLGEAAPDALLLRHPENRGKGAAVMTGFEAALEAGYSHALQIDADGQHSTADIPAFCAAAREFPDGIVCGRPVFDQSVSKLRYYARYITLGFCWLECMSTEIEDAMCGFRVYPIRPVLALGAHASFGQRMTFDPEILVRASWAGMPLQFIAIDVRYPDNGRSHFRYWRDNVEISWMHTRLLAGMLLRLPVLLWRRVSGTRRGAQT